mmetsp:Transcript_43567/g.117507  ORF Transcript_43567/g.117507 Transcript_43567/m.117507 type:complete len:284 (+) Transcript_43567:545-1396(+)
MRASASPLSGPTRPQPPRARTFKPLRCCSAFASAASPVCPRPLFPRRLKRSTEEALRSSSATARPPSGPAMPHLLKLTSLRLAASGKWRASAAKPSAPSSELLPRSSLPRARALRKSEATASPPCAAPRPLACRLTSFSSLASGSFRASSRRLAEPMPELDRDTSSFSKPGKRCKRRAVARAPSIQPKPQAGSATSRKPHSLGRYRSIAITPSGPKSEFLPRSSARRLAAFLASAAAAWPPSEPASRHPCKQTPLSSLASGSAWARAARPAAASSGFLPRSSS